MAAGAYLETARPTIPLASARFRIFQTCNQSLDRKLRPTYHAQAMLQSRSIFDHYLPWAVASSILLVCPAGHAQQQPPVVNNSAPIPAAEIQEYRELPSPYSVIFNPDDIARSSGANSYAPPADTRSRQTTSSPNETFSAGQATQAPSPNPVPSSGQPFYSQALGDICFTAEGSEPIAPSPIGTNCMLMGPFGSSIPGIIGRQQTTTYPGDYKGLTVSTQNNAHFYYIRFDHFVILGNDVAKVISYNSFGPHTSGETVNVRKNSQYLLIYKCKQIMKSQSIAISGDALAQIDELSCKQ